MALQADAAPALSGEPAAGMGTSPSVRSAQGARPRQAAEASVSARQGFLFSPTIDLLFIANLFWPLLLIVDVVGGATTHESLLFWQIYFITAPHRWITLILVAFDREKTAHRGATFASLAIGILLVCLCLQFGTGSLLCLGVIDYIWNAWHFSAQHHGIFRIYERKGGGGGGPAWPRLEKTAFRAYLLFVIASGGGRLDRRPVCGVPVDHAARWGDGNDPPAAGRPARMAMVQRPGDLPGQLDLSQQCDGTVHRHAVGLAPRTQRTGDPTRTRLGRVPFG